MFRRNYTVPDRLLPQSYEGENVIEGEAKILRRRLVDKVPLFRRRTGRIGAASDGVLSLAQGIFRKPGGIHRPAACRSDR